MRKTLSPSPSLGISIYSTPGRAINPFASSLCALPLFFFTPLRCSPTAHPPSGAAKVNHSHRAFFELPRNLPGRLGRRARDLVLHIYGGGGDPVRRGPLQSDLWTRGVPGRRESVFHRVRRPCTRDCERRGRVHVSICALFYF